MTQCFRRVRNKRSCRLPDFARMKKITGLPSLLAVIFSIGDTVPCGPSVTGPPARKGATQRNARFELNCAECDVGAPTLHGGPHRVMRNQGGRPTFYFFPRQQFLTRLNEQFKSGGSMRWTRLILPAASGDEVRFRKPGKRKPEHLYPPNIFSTSIKEDRVAW